MAVAGAALVPVARKGGEAAWKALTGDLVVVNGSVYRRIKSRHPTGKLTPKGRAAYRTVETLEPFNIDVHINPLTIAIGGGAALLAAGVGLWMLGLGVRVLTADERAALEAQAEYLEDFADYVDAYADWLETSEAGERNEQERAACINACQSGTPERHLDECIRRCQQRFPYTQDAGPQPTPPTPPSGTGIALKAGFTPAEYRAEAKEYRKQAAALIRRASIPVGIGERPRGLFGSGKEESTSLWDLIWPF
jgi:hypothetical protein